MDHPSKEWKDRKTQDLLTEKQTDEILDHHFYFKSCKSPKDYEDCFIWELNRTREYFELKYEQKKTVPKELIIDRHEENALSVKIELKDLTDVYPFYIDEFPQIPYLSIPYEVRCKFSSRKGENVNVSGGDSEANYENLLLPMELSDIQKIPIELHIDLQWGKTKTSDLFKAQWNEIAEKLDLNKQDLLGDKSRIEVKYLDHTEGEADVESDGSSYAKKLKLLGHLRLIRCVGLDFDLISDVLDKSFYTDISVFFKEIRKVPMLNDLLRLIDLS
jgi:hypothetical protein